MFMPCETGNTSQAISIYIYISRYKKNQLHNIVYLFQASVNLTDNIMDPTGPVHHKYADLPTTVSSEVLSSQYAAQVIKAGAEENQADLMTIMGEWNDLFRREGVTVSNSIIEVLSEVTLLCGKNGKEELAGRFAGAVVEMANNISKQYMAATSTVSALENLVNNFQDGLEEMKKINYSMNRMLPRIKKASQKKSSSFITEEQAEGDIMQEENKSPDKNQMAEMTSNNTTTPTESHPHRMVDTEILQQITTEGKVKGKEERPDPVDPSSDLARGLRMSYRSFYSQSEKFNSLTEEKQGASIKYYINHILGISDDVLIRWTYMYPLLSDLIDKTKLILLCTKAQASALANDDLKGGILQVMDAIASCHQAYGPVSASMINDLDGRPYLKLTA
ncbi:phosphoprotein [Sowthistle yellow vein virus]|uniref:Phosphoprotein n=1 Tax=Sowthistle yellow vein virus TaxID=2358214 RepID=A0AAE7ABB8_9RHAB|nr:phosphoprotein [Sowthistle yellow vein virus]QJQ80123.1 phosphoprotein [Sowthistle yellow vein virus]